MHTTTQRTQRCVRCVRCVPISKCTQQNIFFILYLLLEIKYIGASKWIYWLVTPSPICQRDLGVNQQTGTNLSDTSVSFATLWVNSDCFKYILPVNSPLGGPKKSLGLKPHYDVITSRRYFWVETMALCILYDRCELGGNRARNANTVVRYRVF